MRHVAGLDGALEALPGVAVTSDRARIIVHGRKLGAQRVHHQRPLRQALRKLTPAGEDDASLDRHLAGRGTGVTDEGLARKQEVIDAALARTGDRAKDPVETLTALGSADLAAATGYLLAAAQDGVPVLLDGLMSVACALTADRIEPGAARWYAAGHRSTEPAQSLALAKLGLEPLLDLGLRLGEGSGAVAAVPVVRSAVALLRDHPRAGSFHLSIAHTGEPQLLSVEYGAFACSVQAVTQPMIHANHAVHARTRNFPQLITGSSGFRQMWGESLLAQQRQAVDPLAILSDTGHPEYPIYRAAPTDSDAENTMATADIRVTAAGIRWQVHESPFSPVRFEMKDAGRSAQG